MKKKIVKIILGLIIFILTLALGAFGLVVWALMTATLPTSQEVEAAINSYRQEKGIEVLTVDFELCNNVVDRYAKLTSEENKNTPHYGLQEWANVKYEEGFTIIAEVFSPRPTLELIMDNWKDSEGHNLAILNPEYKLFCAFVGPKVTVVVLGAK